MGTGWVVDAKRKLVVTNYHVVRDKEAAAVFFPLYVGGALVRDRKAYNPYIARGAGIPGKILARDRKRDLALIQLSYVPQGALALSLAAQEVQPNDRVYSVGNPATGKLWSFFPSKVLKVADFKLTSRKDDFVFKMEARMIQTDASPNGGESGGPLVNSAVRQSVSCRVISSRRGRKRPRSACTSTSTRSRASWRSIRSRQRLPRRPSKVPRANTWRENGQRLGREGFPRVLNWLGRAVAWEPTVPAEEHLPKAEVGLLAGPRRCRPGPMMGLPWHSPLRVVRESAGRSGTG
jgi:hypothetical protein